MSNNMRQQETTHVQHGTRQDNTRQREYNTRQHECKQHKIYFDLFISSLGIRSRYIRL